VSISNEQNGLQNVSPTGQFRPISDFGFRPLSVFICVHLWLKLFRPEPWIKFLFSVLLLLASTLATHASTGAAVPWTTYEAEDMTINGGTILGPAYGPNVIASESSGRRCVALTATGQSVEFTAQAAANALVVRYSVPDTADGTGTNYTLSLYTNGVFAEKLTLTSQYSWLYGNYPWTNHPAAGSPRNFYDEFRTNNLAINAGDRVRLQKDSTDTATNYTIDLVDLESVSAALTAPSNSLSVMTYGAAGNGVTDDTAAFTICLNQAIVQAKSVWLPPGNYKVTTSLTLPSNTTIQGAGMWYTTLTGDPVLYTNFSRRVAFNGHGSNIHLADFAIVGKLNYRNDTEPNDGLGGYYSTNSTISRVWVEHTKTGAWIINSSGLVVNGCRFRDTLADGINLCIGMQGTIVTNCTARGTGDDCFPIWPTTDATADFTPGSNLITHCTGQTPFLANGGAIYGAAGNRIENCQFLDITYGCGLLLSTTFPVGSNVFHGATTVRQSDIIRCGGYDPGYGWRAAVQLCLDRYTNGIAGVALINLNITNSVSDGLSIVGGAGLLTNSVISGVTLRNYGLGAANRHALWARNDAVGSLTVTNSAFARYQNDSATFAFHFTNDLALGFAPPPAKVLMGAILQPEVQVAVADPTGEAATNISVALSLGSGTGNLSGTLVRTTDTNGLAHFNDLRFSAAGQKTLTATVSNGMAPPVTSSSFSVIGPATALSFNTQPAYAIAGAPFFQQPALATVDAFGNFTTSGLPPSLAVSLALTNSAGDLTGDTHCDLGTSAGHGAGTFTNLAITTAGTNDQLVATATGAGIAISPAVSTPFNVPTAPPAQTILGAMAGDNSLISITYATTPGCPYHLVTTSNLVAPVWAAIPGSLTNVPGTSAVFTDPNPLLTGSRFYRTVSP